MIQSLGKITTTRGTPARLTNNQSSPTTRFPAHSFLIEAIETNTGRIFIYDRQTGSLTTGAGVIAYIAVPTANISPSFGTSVANTVASFNLCEIWIEPEVNGEGVYVSAVNA